MTQSSVRPPTAQRRLHLLSSLAGEAMYLPTYLPVAPVRRGSQLATQLFVLGSRITAHASAECSTAGRAVGRPAGRGRHGECTARHGAFSPSQGQRNINRYVYRPTFAGAAGDGPTKIRSTLSTSPPRSASPRLPRHKQLFSTHLTQWGRLRHYTYALSPQWPTRYAIISAISIIAPTVHQCVRTVDDLGINRTRRDRKYVDLILKINI